MAKTLRLEVYGRVQGVNFRSMTKSYADEKGIKGIVRNLEDGSVEVIAQAEEEELKKFINFIKKSPGLSKVKNVFIEELENSETYKDFSILREDNFLIDQGKSIKNLGKSFVKF